MFDVFRHGRVVVPFLVAAVCSGGAVAMAQDQAAAPQALTLDSGAGLMFHQIKQDRTADFEWVMDKIKQAMQKSENAQVKEQATGIKVLKSLDPTPNSTNVMYIVMVDPSVKGADYSMQAMLKMLYEAFPSEQQDIYKRVQGAFGGPTSRVNLQPIADFAK